MQTGTNCSPTMPEGEVQHVVDVEAAAQLHPNETAHLARFKELWQIYTSSK